MYSPKARRGRRYHEGGGSAAQHEDRTPTHHYEPTREAGMAAFAKSWTAGVFLRSGGRPAFGGKPDIEPTSPNERV